MKVSITLNGVKRAKEMQASTNAPETRITPENITQLAENEIFVFGSNAKGLHHGGAAKIAVESFGAIMGQGHGAQGKCYAINSMSGIPDMIEDIDHFYHYAKNHPEMHFFVTPIGCGIAGFRPAEIAPLFKCCKDLQNVSLPKSFWDVIGREQTNSKQFDLNRFLDAQRFSYDTALQEIRSGRKSSHWVWYIFPQLKGLGYSYNSKFFGIDGRDEAIAYLNHSVLGTRLREITTAFLNLKNITSMEVLGGIDDMKVRSCMTLFNAVAKDDLFKRVIDHYYNGCPDQRTLQMLGL